MAKMYYEKDCDLGKLDGKKIAIIGYGSQGHAHALNLKESGCDVCVGLRSGSKNWAAAEEAGLQVKTVAEAAKWGDVVDDADQRRGSGESLQGGCRTQPGVRQCADVCPRL